MTQPQAAGRNPCATDLWRHARLWLIAALLGVCGAAWADPPGRVGRISLIEGQVWVRDVTSSESFAPAPNWPVSQATAVDTGAASRAEIRIGSSTVRMGADTRLSFDRLDDNAIRIRLERGTIAVRHRNVDNARETTVVTRGGTVSFVETGRYRIDANDDGVAVAVMQGAARWDSPTASYGARTGLRMELGYDGYARSTDVFNDGFDDWVARLDRRDDQRAAPRYVSRELTGYDALDDHGVWTSTADYGPVWYPTVVVAGWAPYRYGRWVNYGPWGWTWIDDAPWGFAVSHYGRWAWIDGRWGWVPGAIVPRPVWAPALVAWAGGPGWSFSVSLGAPAVSWVPLAPAEVFVPYYAVSPRYCTAVNITHVTNVTVINNYYQNPGSQAYANAQVPGAVSAAAAGAALARGAVAATPQQARVIRAVTDARIAQEAFYQHRLAAPAVNNPVRIPVSVAPPAGGLAPAVAAARAANLAAVNGRPLPPQALQAVNAAPATPQRPGGIALPENREPGRVNMPHENREAGRANSPPPVSSPGGRGAAAAAAAAAPNAAGREAAVAERMQAPATPPVAHAQPPQGVQPVPRAQPQPGMQAPPMPRGERAPQPERAQPIPRPQGFPPPPQRGEPGRIAREAAAPRPEPHREPREPRENRDGKREREDAAVRRMQEQR